MFDFGSVRNFAKAISAGATHREEDSERGGAAGPRFRKTSRAEADAPAPMHASAPSSHDDVHEGHDPLIYRLQHQQRYLEEKQLGTRSEKMMRSQSKNRRSAQRDPFDLGGSFTSDEASLHDLTDSVDVVGWGESNSPRRRDSQSSSSEETTELYVDFGGVTPSDAKGGKRRSICDAIHVSPPKFSPPDSSQHPANSQNLHLKHPPRRPSTLSNNSNISSVSKNSPNNSYISGGNERSEHCTPCHRPSHEDLSHILSSLEKETLSSAPPSQTRPSALSCDSTLSSPTSKCRRSLSRRSSPLHEDQHVSCAASPLPFLPRQDPTDRTAGRENSGSPKTEAESTSNFSRKQQQPLSMTQLTPREASLRTPPKRQPPKREEDDDPRLAQLKQQTADELRTELSKMQSQSKTNLENSWAATERMRVENSELDDQLDKARQKLAASRAAMLSVNGEGGQQGTPPINKANNDGGNNKFSPGDIFSLGGDSLGRKSQQKVMRRSTSANTLVDLSQDAGQFSPLPGSVGRSYCNKKKKYSADAANVLMGNAVDIHEAASSRSCSDKPNRGLLADLGKSFRVMKPQGGSVAGSDSDLGSGIYICDQKVSRGTNFDGSETKQEGNDQSSTLPPSKLCTSPTLQNEKHTKRQSPGDDVRSCDDESIDVRNGVFYPPPGEEEEEMGVINNSRNASKSTGGSEMDDFDFDPLSESARKKSVNERRKERGRPSLRSFFEAKDDDENSIEFSSNIPQQNEGGAVMAKEIIPAKDNEIEQMVEMIRIQVDDMRKCELEILRVNVEGGKDENKLKAKESTLQKEIEELERKDSAIEWKLESAEGSAENARGKENDLKEKLANLKEAECDVDLENQLSSYQEQYNVSQENAIISLSSILNDFEAMGIPSLRGELEDSVCGDIIARFDDLTDKEEELVEVLSDSDRLTSCQASFQQIQKHIEMAMSWQNQLGHLETDLHSYLVTITMLIKQDDEGTHTTESSTASERLSLERMFVEAIILRLESAKQEQGKLILDALFKSVEFLTNWDQWLLPDFLTPPLSKPSVENLGTGVRTIAMLSGVVKKARVELNAVKADVFNEKDKFIAKMQRAGLSCGPNSNGIFDSCNVNNTADGIGPSHDDSGKRLTKEYEVDELSKQISQQISAAETIMSERRSLIGKHDSLCHSMPAQARESPINYLLLDDLFEEDNTAEQLEALDKEICAASRALLEKESLRNMYSSELGSMQAKASKDAKDNLKMLNDIQVRIKHILAALESQQQMKRNSDLRR